MRHGKRFHPKRAIYKRNQKDIMFVVEPAPLLPWPCNEAEMPEMPVIEKSKAPGIETEQNRDNSHRHDSLLRCQTHLPKRLLELAYVFRFLKGLYPAISSRTSRTHNASICSIMTFLHSDSSFCTMLTSSSRLAVSRFLISASLTSF